MKEQIMLDDINNKSLNDVKKYYGEYPNYKKDVDSITSRFNWIINSPDFGFSFLVKSKLKYLFKQLIKFKVEVS